MSIFWSESLQQNSTNRNLPISTYPLYQLKYFRAWCLYEWCYAYECRSGPRWLAWCILRLAIRKDSVRGILSSCTGRVRLFMRIIVRSRWKSRPRSGCIVWLCVGGWGGTWFALRSWHATITLMNWSISSLFPLLRKFSPSSCASPAILARNFPFPVFLYSQNPFSTITAPNRPELSAVKTTIDWSIFPISFTKFWTDL